MTVDQRMDTFYSINQHAPKLKTMITSCQSFYEIFYYLPTVEKRELLKKFSADELQKLTEKLSARSLSLLLQSCPSDDTSILNVGEE